MVARNRLRELPGFPFESRFLPVGGHRMHFVDEGPPAGPVVVMVHGNPTWCYFYRRLVAGLRPRYRCIALDHIGMGLSARPDDTAYPYRLARRVDDLEELLAGLGVGGGITLVLHDWGGLIGMAFAARHPERIARLVLLNTGAFRLPPGVGVPWQIRAFRGPLGLLLVARLNAFCRAAARLCSTRGLPPAVRHAYLAPYSTWSERRAVLRFLQDIPIDDRDPGFALLEEVEASYPRFTSVPALLLWGMRDFVFTAAFLERFTELLPHAAVRRFPHGGHYLLEDHPEEVLAAVGAFFDAHPVPAATAS